MPLALAYVRRSKNSKKRPSASPERQASNIDDLAQQRGWTLEWFRDTEGHKSGLTEHKRPAWLALKARLEKARPGEIAAVVVNSLDRSSRKAKDFLNFLDLCQQRRADFVAVTQPYLDTTTPYGRAMVANLIIFAQLEAEIDGQRVTEDIEYRQSEGVMWGPAPIGYGAVVAHEDGQRFKVRRPDDDAPLVRRALEAYAQGDVSMRHLAALANTWPAPHVPGGLWRMRRRDGSRVPFTARSIESLLDNAPIYAGQVIRYRGRDGEEAFVGKHEPIVDEELAQKVRAARESRQDKRLVSARLAPQHVYLLSGLLYCAVCGRRWRGQVLNGRPRYWHGPGSHGTARADAAAFEADVLNRFRGWTIPTDVARQIVESADHDGARAPDPADDERERQIGQLRSQLAREKDLYAMGDRTREEFVERRNLIEAAIARLAPPTERAAGVGDAAAVVSQLQTLLTGVGEATRPQQRALLHTLFERLETDGHKITSLTPRPWFGQLVKEVIIVYPQPALTVDLHHLLERATPEQIRYRDRAASRNQKIRALRLQGWRLRELAAAFGVSIERVRQICAAG